MLTEEMFDNNEKIILNGMLENLLISNFSKRKCLELLSFSLAVCGDEDMSSALEQLIEKIEDVSDDEWLYLRLLMPFSEGVTADEVI